MLVSQRQAPGFIQESYDFPGLNALRFYAAISVLVQHVMVSPRDWFGVEPLPDTLGRLFINGTDAVHMFFVLSGFLITRFLRWNIIVISSCRFCG